VAQIGTTEEGRSYETKPGLAERIRYRLRIPADPVDANGRLLEAAGDCDIVWLDSALTVRADTLRRIRARADAPRIVWHSEDDVMSPKHRSRWLDRAFPLIDLWVTTKSFNVRPEELPARGLRRAMFVDNGFDPDIHRPVEHDAAAREAFGAAVSFVGTFEGERAQSMLHLARSGVEVRIWGNGWGRMQGAHPKLRVEGRALYDDDYARVLSASDINLAFLRKANRDLQTTRTAEIPACGAFMLHERTDETLRLFREDAEAAYFGDDDELLAQCRRWLADAPARKAVAAAAHERAHALGLRHQDILARVFRAALAEPVAA
jgi:spore maturation protein CgeB